MADPPEEEQQNAIDSLDEGLLDEEDSEGNNGADTKTAQPGAVTSTSSAVKTAPISAVMSSNHRAAPTGDKRASAVKTKGERKAVPPPPTSSQAGPGHQGLQHGAAGAQPGGQGPPGALQAGVPPPASTQAGPGHHGLQPGAAGAQPGGHGPPGALQAGVPPPASTQAGPGRHELQHGAAGAPHGAQPGPGHHGPSHGATGAPYGVQPGSQGPPGLLQHAGVPPPASTQAGVQSPATTQDGSGHHGPPHGLQGPGGHVLPAGNATGGAPPAVQGHGGQILTSSHAISTPQNGYYTGAPAPAQLPYIQQPGPPQGPNGHGTGAHALAPAHLPHVQQPGAHVPANHPYVQQPGIPYGQPLSYSHVATTPPPGDQRDAIMSSPSPYPSPSPYRPSSPSDPDPTPGYTIYPGHSPYPSYMPGYGGHPMSFRHPYHHYQVPHVPPMGPSFAFAVPAAPAAAPAAANAAAANAVATATAAPATAAPADDVGSVDPTQAQAKTSPPSNSNMEVAQSASANSTSKDVDKPSSSKGEISKNPKEDDGKMEDVEMEDEGEEEPEIVDSVDRTPFMGISTFKTSQMFTAIPQRLKKSDGSYNVPPNGDTLPERFEDNYFRKMQAVYGEPGESYDVFQHRMITAAKVNLGPDRIFNSIWYDPDKVEAENKAFKALIAATKASEKEYAKQLEREARNAAVRDIRNYRGRKDPNPHLRDWDDGAPQDPPAQGRGRGAPAAQAQPQRPPRGRGGRGRSGGQGGPPRGPPAQGEPTAERLRRLANYNMFE